MARALFQILVFPYRLISDKKIVYANFKRYEIPLSKAADNDNYEWKRL